MLELLGAIDAETGRNSLWPRTQQAAPDQRFVSWQLQQFTAYNEI